MRFFSGYELIIVLVIVLILFGVGRISKVGGELGKGIRAFKDGLDDPMKEDEGKSSESSSE